MPTPTPTVAPNVNLSLGKPVTTTSNVSYLPGGLTVDGQAGTYWESVNGAFPQSMTIDLGASRSLGRAVLKLPPAAAWGARTQTLTVLGSADGVTYRTLAASAGVRFDAATGNTATVALTPGQSRYVRLTVTANTGWPAAQIAEFELYAS